MDTSEKTIPEIIDDVISFNEKIAQLKYDLATLKEQADEVIATTTEADNIKELNLQLERAKMRLNQVLTTKPEYNNLMENLGSKKDELKSIQQDLSDFLLAYFHQTGEKQIELGTLEAREVVFKGRLGKKTLFQTNIFTRKEESPDLARKDLN